MFYSTLCFKMGTYFRDVFELNTAEHKLLHHHKLTVKWRTIEIALTQRPVAKQIGILLTYISLIVMVRNCYVYFILLYA